MLVRISFCRIVVLGVIVAFCVIIYRKGVILYSSSTLKSNEASGQYLLDAIDWVTRWLYVDILPEKTRLSIPEIS